MPYHTRRGNGAVDLIAETAREALEKAAEDGNPDVVIMDLVGNILD